jgi:arylsulfatase A-like enzyme
LSLLDSVARGVVGSIVAAAAVAAFRLGGGAEARLAPPEPVTTPSASSSAASVRPHTLGGEAYEVKLRLTDAMSDARIDAPSLVASKPFMQSHWRRMIGPWTHPSGPAGQMVMSEALLTSRMELQWSVPLSDGTAWAPSARTWNMNEGSYDQRDSIFAPTPATISFHLTVPAAARFDFSPATLDPVPATTVFTVSVVGSDGKSTVVATRRIATGDARHWFDDHADLSAFAGQAVELRLETSTDHARTSEQPPPPPEDAGAPESDAKPPPAPTMSLAMWGNPVVSARAPTRVPYNVLWIVVDALRPDVVASLHDDASDAKMQAAEYPPLEALLPKVEGITPNIDSIAMHGVRFFRGYSAGAWTRPGTLSMLSGMRSSELGLDTAKWIMPPEQTSRFYASDPPLLPLTLRRNGVSTAAFVNNFFMSGYAQVGIDFGFEHFDDSRYRTEDTAEITAHAVEWLKANAGARFMLFANYNSPHEPYDPPATYRKRIPPPPVGPKDPQIRLYMAEAAKDDDGIGVLVKTLDDLDLRKNTIIVVTADHGETLSQAHGGEVFFDNAKQPVRYHHAASCFEETTKVPMIVSLPGVADGGRGVTERVRNVDLVPTILELEGLEPSPRITGKSLMPLIRGEKEKDARVVVSEGRSMRAIIAGKWRLILREKEAQFVAGYATGQLSEELFDLETDPGERHNVARDRPEIVDEMKARLVAALANVPVAGSAAATDDDRAGDPTLHVRFAGGGGARRVSGTMTIGDPLHPTSVPPTVTFEPIFVANDALRIEGGRLTVSLTTVADESVGFDLHVSPPATPVTWQLFLDDEPWPAAAVFDGPFGLEAHAATNGVATDEARAEVYSPAVAEIDPRRDLGLFITRDRRSEAASSSPASAEGAGEMSRLLQQWGYAHGSGGGK